MKQRMRIFLTMYALSGPCTAETAFQKNATCIAIAFSPNGKTLAVAGYDRNIQLWDITTGKCFRLQSFQRNGRRKHPGAFIVANHTRIEFSDETEMFVWGLADSSRIVIPTASACPDRVGATDASELPIVAKGSIFLDFDGLYVHGRKLLDIPTAYYPITYDYKDGLFAIGRDEGRVYFIKLKLDHLLDPVA
ncbi:uncharacterized protein DFL_009324 [Arthrobotrys flagrans]|uniref:Uncharacterized protein n=1 Tax=Arthrobotrys flagrans TaxID=97331 RepID=A0A436ZRA2_ARTFL|nr:hypothetical protein DFL_009324 [Arthrobotrys flagrans]